LAFLSVVLMGLDNRLEWTDHLRATLLAVIHPVQQVVGAPVHLATSGAQQLQAHWQVYEKNQQLQERIQTLRLENQELAALRRENHRLRDLLNEAQRLERQVSAARIVAESPDPFHHTVTISRGRGDGAFANQPVISEEGVVGQITALAPNTAQVTLLTDPNSGIPVLVRRTRVRGLLFGTGNRNRLELRYVPSNAEVAKGDHLVTSGLGEVYPKGLLAARVIEVVRNPHAPFAEITARPVVAVNRLEDVLLLETQAPARDPQAKEGAS
jgi:rod shape-determining protein MreC